MGWRNSAAEAHPDGIADRQSDGLAPQHYGRGLVEALRCGADEWP
jgi:hypothetical protein